MSATGNSSFDSAADRLHRKTLYFSSGNLPVVIHGTIPTNIERELLFGISHTLHHFALIAPICRHHDYPCPDDFGIAPSTLAYRKARLKKE